VVLLDKPDMLLVKAPVPVPSTVLVVNAIVGLAVVLQQTPLAVMEAPPSLVIVPPDMDVVALMLVGVVVESVGVFALKVLNVTSAP
jgi:hypothetical protein